MSLGRIFFWCSFTAFALTMLSGCCPEVCQDLKEAQNYSLAPGGGQDAITIDLPFDEGVASRCTQGVGGVYSHDSNSTWYDLDFDTPNDTDVPLYAPIGGVAYVHDTDPTHNFGNHVNIDLGDGTYLVLGHLKSIFIEDGEVAPGQLLGFEGTTGASTGDHVHLGRHQGYANEDAIYGESIEGLIVASFDPWSYSRFETLAEDVNCDLVTGDVLVSDLRTPRHHPDGTLVKLAGSEQPYLVLDGGLSFITESSFIGVDSDPRDIVPISEEEFACYALKDPVTLPTPSGVFQDGDLVSPLGKSDVFVMNDSYGYPIINWDTYLLMGFGPRQVIELPDEQFDFLVPDYGDCAAGENCVTRDLVLTCGEEASDPDGDTSDDSGSTSTAEGGYTTAGLPLLVTWRTPDNVMADRISVYGEYTSGGNMFWSWSSPLAEVYNLSQVNFVLFGLEPGDYVSFSLEYRALGETSWACLGPYPPGLVNGTSTATFGLDPIPVSVVDDPASDGCVHMVTIE